MARYKVWYGESQSHAEYVIANTRLNGDVDEIVKIYPTISNDFVKNPDLIQQILYLDQPDVIVTAGFPEKPVLAIEFCGEAPTSHNFFQRISRVVAAAEFGTPFAFVMPERLWVTRAKTSGWDVYNPDFLKALLQIARFHRSPVLGFFWPADETVGDANQGYLLFDHGFALLPDSQHEEIAPLWEFVDLVLEHDRNNVPASEMAYTPYCGQREAWMWEKYWERARSRSASRPWCPVSACEVIATSDLPDYLGNNVGVTNQLELPGYVEDREETLIYSNRSTTFRADPYAGCLVGIDYLQCRNGHTIHHRHRNLAIHFREASFSQISDMYQRYYAQRCPFSSDCPSNIRFLNLHLRDGCRFTKNKEMRIMCHFADLLIFSDAVIY